MRLINTEAVFKVVQAPDDGCQHTKHVELPTVIQGESLARSPKLLSIKIMLLR